MRGPGGKLHAAYELLPGTSRIAACVSRGRSSCGTWPQFSSTCLAAGSARSTCFMKAIGTSVSWRPQTNSESGSSACEPGPEAVVAVRLVQVDVARRGVEGGPPARRQVRAQELVHAGRGPAAVRRRHEPPHHRLHDRPRRQLDQAQLRPQRAHHRRPAPVAQPRQRRAQQHQAAARGSRSVRPASIATRPPMLLPTTWALSTPSASIGVEHRAREPRGVVRRADRLVRLAEAREGPSPPRGSARRARATVGRNDAFVPPRPCTQRTVVGPGARGKDRDSARNRACGASRTRAGRARRLAVRRGQEAHAHVEAAADPEAPRAEGAPCRRGSPRRCARQVAGSALRTASGSALSSAPRSRMRRPAMTAS